MLPRGSEQRDKRPGGAFRRVSGRAVCLCLVLRAQQEAFWEEAGGRPFVTPRAASWERTESAERASGPEAEAPEAEEKIGGKGQEEMGNCLRIWRTGRQVHLGFSVRM